MSRSSSVNLVLALIACILRAGMLLPVQKVALSVFPTLPPLPDGELWLALLNTLLRLLKPHQLEQVRTVMHCLRASA